MLKVIKKYLAEHGITTQEFAVNRSVTEIELNFVDLCVELPESKTRITLFSLDKTSNVIEFPIFMTIGKTISQIFVGSNSSVKLSLSPDEFVHIADIISKYAVLRGTMVEYFLKQGFPVKVPSDEQIKHDVLSIIHSGAYFQW